MKIIYREQYEKEVLKNEILVRDLKDLQQENRSLKDMIKRITQYNQEILDNCLNKYNSDYEDGMKNAATYNLQLIKGDKE